MRRVRLQFFGTVAIIRRSVGQSVCPVAGRSASRRDFCRQTPCWLGISGHSVLCLSAKGPYGQSIVGRFIVSSVGSTTVLSLLSVVWLVVRSIGRLVCRSICLCFSVCVVFFTSCFVFPISCVVLVFFVRFMVFLVVCEVCSLLVLLR